jgi:uncharacterized protein YhfF
MPPLPSVETVVAKVSALGIKLPPGSVRVDGYRDRESLPEELLALIRSGKKRAGTGLLLAHEAEGTPIPRVGDIEIVIDHRHEPALVTRITTVEIVPYGSITAEYAAIEGEGDGSPEFWRKAHWAFLSRECQRLGREPEEAMLVVCSVFEVLNVLPPSHTV